jgi:hypothetical protein
VAALRRVSWEFRLRFDAIFAPEYMHVASHLALFFVLALLLAAVIEFPPRRGWLGGFGVILLVGLLQEGFQLWSGSAYLTWNLAFDLGVDLAGGLLGWSLAEWVRRRRKPLKV